MNEKDPAELSPDEIERIEKLTLRWVFQATLAFGMEAREVFVQSPDKAQDIAEDITRELLDRLPGFNVAQRVYGTVDYKKARFVILPEATVRQALFIDSKAEKHPDTATLQMSQTSLRVRQKRAGREWDEAGGLPAISAYDGKNYLTTTCLVHFMYADDGGMHLLRQATLVALPNGKLQDKYNPNAENGIWRAGRDAPTRGEDFRVRLSFDELQKKAAWRVQRLQYDQDGGACVGTWQS